MHLLIILLQQLLGMLPSSKQVPQPEVVRKGSAPNSGEPDACGRVVVPLGGWMTPFRRLHFVAQPTLSAATPIRAAADILLCSWEPKWATKRFRRSLVNRCAGQAHGA